jgi:hypothetical protein
MTPPRTDPAPADTDLRAVLDDELAWLPARYREVLVLSDLEGKERRRVAHELGIPEGTAASRLTRARRLLAARLSRRGWGPAGGLAGVAGPALLSAGTEEAVARAAVGFAAGVTGAAGRVVLLAERVVRAMSWKKVVEPHLAAWVGRNREHRDELQERLVEAALPCDLTATVQVARWVYQQTEKANGQVWVTEKVLQHLSPSWAQCSSA